MYSFNDCDFGLVLGGVGGVIVVVQGLNILGDFFTFCVKDNVFCF